MSTVRQPKILLPKKDFEHWAVVACDQFTSEPKYWEEVKKYTDGHVSAYNVILPEAYLSQNNDKYIKSINAKMQEYINADVFDEVDGFVLVERSTTTGIRLGLMIEVDLTKYDFTPFADVQIKATEGTILERIPPRVKIREDAPLELPHIMLLCDDPKGVLIEHLYSKRDQYKVLYDFDLCQNGGHIKGYLIDNPQEVLDIINVLNSKEEKIKKYGKETEFLFAVGDGNHSLATAKACYEKAPNEYNRYALVELVNIYDKGLAFEPIHRVIFGASKAFIDGLNAFGAGDTIKAIGTDDFTVPGDTPTKISKIQKYIEQSLKDNTISGVDYVHGINSLTSVVESNVGSIGIVMPKMEKSELFPYVLNSGVLPKKAFSMGEAQDKRYYLEARRIRK